MNTPNLASRPFLNTRPVWLVTLGTGVLALALAGVNFDLWLASSRGLEAQLARQQRLVDEQREVATRVTATVAALDRVPWRTLSRQVESFNGILTAHAFSWLGLLDDVERVLPREVRVSRISPTVGKGGVELGLDGIASTRAAFLELLDNLIADRAFAEPRPRSERHPEQSSSATYEFTVSVRYLPGDMAAEETP